MSGFKIKPPKKPRRKSPEFIAKQLARAEAQQKEIPAEATEVRIYLDDERECPEGWVLARNGTELFKALDALPAGMLTEISLDWYLGSGRDTGVEISERLRDMMLDDPGRFSGLRKIHFHSSDNEKRFEMKNIFSEVVLGDERWRHLRLRMAHRS